MKFTAVLLVIAFSTDFVCCFTWQDCGEEDSPVRFERLSINPPEPELSKDLYLDAKVRILQPILNGTISSFKVTKFIGHFIKIPVPMPCISGIGSCKSSFCDMFKGEDACKYIRNPGDHCGCPILPGVYYSRRKKPIKLQTNNAFQGMIAKGRYIVEWKWLTPQNTELSCLKLDFTLK